MPQPILPTDHPALATVAALMCAFESGDLDAAMALYADDAAFYPEPGQLLHGKAQIRPALQSLMALKPRMRLHAHVHAATADIALLHSDWEMHGQAPDGSPMQMRARSADVLARGADGQWRIQVDNPFGTALLDLPAAA